MLMWQTISGALQALGRIRSWGVIQVLGPALLVAALILMVVVLSLGVRGAILAWASAQALLAGSAVFVGRDLWWPKAGSSVSYARLRPIMSLRLRLGVASLVTFAQYRIDVFLLQVYMGLHAVGIYSLATNLAELVFYVPSALATSIVAPAISASEARAAVIAAEGARNAIVATILAGAVVAAGSTVGLAAIYGQAFASAQTPLLVLILSTVSIAPATCFAVYFSMKLGRSRYSLVGALVSTSVTGVCAVLLIPRLGVIGAAIATTLGYSVSEVVEVVWFIRRSGLPASSLVPRRTDLAAYPRLVGSVISGLRSSLGSK
jgi:O-antigen/teichoic acid export membrane protein